MLKTFPTVGRWVDRILARDAACSYDGMQTSGLKAAVLLTGWVGMEICARTAFAAPPGASPLNSMSRPSVTQRASQIHLDLRAPAQSLPAEERAPVFPSAFAHRRFAATEETAQLPTLAAGNPRVRAPLPELARHIQHEGLPIARLWENRSALVHIGLNQRGKPGLWLVQKIH
jgi:hypothetical protein